MQCDTPYKNMALPLTSLKTQQTNSKHLISLHAYENLKYDLTGLQKEMFSLKLTIFLYQQTGRFRHH